MYCLVSIEKEPKKKKKNLPIGQTMVSPSFGPVFTVANRYRAVFDVRPTYQYITWLVLKKNERVKKKLTY